MCIKTVPSSYKCIHVVFRSTCMLAHVLLEVIMCMLIFSHSSPHSPNRTPLPVVPLIGTGRHIQLSSITTTASAANIPIYPANGVTKPHYHYSSRNKSTINPRGDYHAKLTACRVPGQRPLRPRPLRLSHRLDVYPIPDYLRECAREEQNEDIVTVEPSLGEVNSTYHTSGILHT